MTKAEELANEHWSQWTGAPTRAQIVALMHDYGRLVQEAAAKHLDAQATCGCNNAHGPCMIDDPPKAFAKAIREMPLP